MNLNSLPMMEKDKANHAVYGSYIAAAIVIVVALILELLGMFVGWYTLLPLILGVVGLTVIAYVKERYSLNTGRGEYSMRDFWASIFGGLPIFLVYIVAVVF